MSVINELDGFIANKWQAIQTILTIAKLEAKLARLSLMPLAVNIVLLLFIGLTLWLSCVGLLGYSIYFFTANVFWSFGGMVLCNILILCLLVLYLRFNLKCISFAQTRQYFSEQNTEESGHEYAKKIAKRHQ